MILGAFAIAGQANTVDIQPLKPQFSGTFVACVQQALAQKKSSLASALQTYHHDMLEISAIKKQALLDAKQASGSQAIHQAKAQARSTYKASLSSLKTTLHTTQKSLWATYKTQTKQCSALK